MWKKMPNLRFLLIVCCILIPGSIYFRFVPPEELGVKLLQSGWYTYLIICAVAIGCLIKSIHDRKKGTHIKFVRLQKS